MRPLLPDGHSLQLRLPETKAGVCVSTVSIVGGCDGDLPDRARADQIGAIVVVANHHRPVAAAVVPTPGSMVADAADALLHGCSVGFTYGRYPDRSRLGDVLSIDALYSRGPSNLTSALLISRSRS